MQAKGQTEVEADARPLLGELSAEALQVFGDVRAGGEKIWQDQDSFRTERNTAGSTLRDRWLGQFEVCGLDDVARKARVELLGQCEQVGVGCGKAAAVSDQQDCGAGIKRANGHRINSREHNNNRVPHSAFSYPLSEGEGTDR